ncbi:hypothetical protein PUN28_019173 [Cardiocondyla obscurior]|uniref:Ribosomal protein S14 n=1 Tax=Cardiocondyla obscurior TaxID=286306 RepID=A0AAW2EFX6_9HYME
MSRNVLSTLNNKSMYNKYVNICCDKQKQKKQSSIRNVLFQNTYRVVSRKMRKISWV